MGEALTRQMCPPMAKTNINKIWREPTRVQYMNAAQENKNLIQRHRFLEVRDGNSAIFISEAWNQEQSIEN